MLSVLEDSRIPNPWSKIATSFCKNPEKNRSEVKGGLLVALSEAWDLGFQNYDENIEELDSMMAVMACVMDNDNSVKEWVNLNNSNELLMSFCQAFLKVLKQFESSSSKDLNLNVYIRTFETFLYLIDKLINAGDNKFVKLMQEYSCKALIGLVLNTSLKMSILISAIETLMSLMEFPDLIIAPKLLNQIQIEVFGSLILHADYMLQRNIFAIVTECLKMCKDDKVVFDIASKFCKAITKGTDFVPVKAILNLRKSESKDFVQEVSSLLLNINQKLNTGTTSVNIKTLSVGDISLRSSLVHFGKESVCFSEKNIIVRVEYCFMKGLKGIGESKSISLSANSDEIFTSIPIKSEQLNIVFQFEESESFRKWFDFLNSHLTGAISFLNSVHMVNLLISNSLDTASLSSRKESIATTRVITYHSNSNKIPLKAVPIPMKHAGEIFEEKTQHETRENISEIPVGKTLFSSKRKSKQDIDLEPAKSKEFAKKVVSIKEPSDPEETISDGETAVNKFAKSAPIIKNHRVKKVETNKKGKADIKNSLETEKPNESKNLKLREPDDHSHHGNVSLSKNSKSTEPIYESVLPVSRKLDFLDDKLVKNPVENFYEKDVSRKRKFNPKITTSNKNLKSSNVRASQEEIEISDLETTGQMMELDEVNLKSLETQIQTLRKNLQIRKTAEIDSTSKNFHTKLNHLQTFFEEKIDRGISNDILLQVERRINSALVAQKKNMESFKLEFNLVESELNTAIDERRHLERAYQEKLVDLNETLKVKTKEIYMETSNLKEELQRKIINFRNSLN